MIITCKKEIPFRWILFAIMPWASFAYIWGAVGAAFLFSLKKFVENPAGLTFILSLPTFVSMVTGPCVSFLSDRIWTRFGRRKPFIVSSWTGSSIFLMLMPLMPNFWALLAVFMLYNFSFDFTSPIDPLKLEIIPPHERGRAVGAMQWFGNVGSIVFYFVALGRFDDVRFMAGLPVAGETIIYWSAALLLSVMLLLITLGIKEIDQKSPLCGQRLSIKTFFGGVLDRELWPVYMLSFGAAALASGLGPLGNLLYTDQWGYTKQEMGINIAVGGTINLFIIGLLTFFADKLNRMRAYQTLITISVTINVIYFCYVTFLLPNQRPSLLEIIVFGETGTIIALLSSMVYVPLVYDYIRRNKMGTYVAGAGLVSRTTSFITINGVGLFIWAYATLFQPPAGEMTRVVVRDIKSQQAEIRSILHTARWTYPETNTEATPSSVVANAWQANGTVSPSGCGWEIRLRDKDSEKLSAHKEELDKERSPLLADEKMYRDQIHILALKGKADSATSLGLKADEKKARSEALTTQIEAIDANLTRRAKQFHRQVAAVLGDQLIREGEQILNARLGQALVVELPTTTRPDPRLLEKILAELRSQLPDIIDLRPLKLDSGYGIAISAVASPALNDADYARTIQAALATVARHRAPGLIPDQSLLLNTSRQSMLQLDLMVIEDPIDTYVSPITRGVNLVLGLFDSVPKPDHILAAIARNLRSPNEINHVRLAAGPSPKTITVSAVLPSKASSAATPNDPTTQRLKYFLGSGESLGQARAFYDRIEKNAATQQITVAHPLITSGYAPVKYNYMSGYLWMFLMGIIGITITIVFGHLERRGFVNKRGIEELQTS